MLGTLQIEINPDSEFLLNVVLNVSLCWCKTSTCGRGYRSYSRKAIVNKCIVY